MQDIQLPLSRVEGRQPQSEPLNLDTSRIIKNRTAYRISITLGGEKQPPQCIILPPFGNYIGSRAELNRSTCVDWERMGLVICEDRRVYRRPGEVLRDAFNYVIGGSLLSTMSALVPSLRETTWFWGVLVSVMLLVTLISVPGLWSLLMQVLSNLFIYVVVGLIGIGLPVLFLRLGMPLSPLALEDWLWCLLIGVLAALPATLFYLCYGLNLRRIRKQMIYDILHLDASIQTIEEAESRYGELLDDTIGTKHGHVPFRGHVFVLLLTALLTVGWSSLILSVPIIRFEALPILTTVSLQWGFFGAYLFALWMAFQRYMRSDINAKCFVTMTVRLLQTLVLAWLLPWGTAWVFGDVTGWAEVGLAALAFGLGFLPEPAMTGLIVLFQRIRQLHPLMLMPDRYHLLRDVDGLSLYDQTRLRSEGIENVSHLVNFSLIELLLRTRFPAHQLVDLIDQALLALYVGATTQRYNAKGQDPALHILQAHGIRTATSFETVIEELQKTPVDYQTFLTLFEQGQTNQGATRIKMILDALKSEEQMQNLRYWRKLHRDRDKVHTWRQFCLACRLPLSANTSAALCDPALPSC